MLNGNFNNFERSLPAMLITTKAILIHHVRYSDHSLIAHLYTRDYGRLPVMVKGVSSRRASTRLNYFQPLGIFNAELYYYEKRELHNMKEMSLAYVPQMIHSDIHRTTMAVFISEILHNVIREEDANTLLYDFIESSVIALDEASHPISNFHLWFLVALTDYTGIGPTHTTRDNCYFDMATGQFTSIMPMHRDFLHPPAAALLNRLLQMPAEETGSLQLSGEERSYLLTQLLRYYNLHLPGIREIRSLQVFKEIFRQG